MISFRTCTLIGFISAGGLLSCHLRSSINLRHLNLSLSMNRMLFSPSKTAYAILSGKKRIFPSKFDIHFTSWRRWESNPCRRLPVGNYLPFIAVSNSSECFSSNCVSKMLDYFSFRRNTRTICVFIKQ